MIKRLNKYSLLMLLVASMAVGACTYNPITDPTPAALETTIDYGPIEYKAGYEDGCKSALSAYGNTYMKTVYALRKRPEYQYNNLYNQIWRDAWNYCYMWYFVYNRKDILYGENIL